MAATKAPARSALVRPRRSSELPDPTAPEAAQGPRAAPFSEVPGPRAKRSQEAGALGAEGPEAAEALVARAPEVRADEAAKVAQVHLVLHVPCPPQALKASGSALPILSGPVLPKMKGPAASVTLGPEFVQGPMSLYLLKKSSKPRLAPTWPRLESAPTAKPLPRWCRPDPEPPRHQDPPPPMHRMHPTRPVECLPCH